MWLIVDGHNFSCICLHMKSLMHFPHLCFWIGHSGLIQEMCNDIPKCITVRVQKMSCLARKELKEDTQMSLCDTREPMQSVLAPQSSILSIFWLIVWNDLQLIFIYSQTIQGVAITSYYRLRSTSPFTDRQTFCMALYTLDWF